MVFELEFSCSCIANWGLFFISCIKSNKKGEKFPSALIAFTPLGCGIIGMSSWEKRE